MVKSKEQKGSLFNLRRPSIRNFKSVDTVPANLDSPSKRKSSFSVKKLMKVYTTASQPKLTSMENFETLQEPKKNKEYAYFVPKS